MALRVRCNVERFSSAALRAAFAQDREAVERALERVDTSGALTGSEFLRAVAQEADVRPATAFMVLRAHPLVSADAGR